MRLPKLSKTGAKASWFAKERSLGISLYPKGLIENIRKIAESTDSRTESERSRVQSRLFRQQPWSKRKANWKPRPGLNNLKEENKISKVIDIPCGRKRKRKKMKKHKLKKRRKKMRHRKKK